MTRETRPGYFINPYNLVRTGGGVVRRPVDSTAGQPTRTGYIDCTLTNHTPLLVAENAAAEQELRFFRVGGKPVIPGSELRGMLRQIYEILTDGCFSVNADTPFSVRDSLYPKRQPGILQWSSAGDCWELYEAFPCENGADAVLYAWRTLHAQKRKDVYWRKGRQLSARVAEEDIRDYHRCLDIYVDNAQGSANAAAVQEMVERVRPVPGDASRLYPVWYRERKQGGYSLAPTGLSRTIYRRTVADFLRAQGGYHPCDGADGLVCPACALFGMAQTALRLGSRVRVGDAAALSPWQTGWTVLKPLQSPKVTATEFYSLRRELQQYEDVPRWSYDDGNTILRGRKIYLHNPRAASDPAVYTADAKGRFNRKAELLMPGATFAFKVYFNAVTDDELKALLLALTLGENRADGPHMHKLGYGKPLGLGSVKVTVQHVYTRDIANGIYVPRPDPEMEAFRKTLEAGQSLLARPAGAEPLPSSVTATPEVLQDLLCATDWNYTKGEIVAYPLADDGRGRPNSTASHQWFRANRQCRKGRLWTVLRPLGPQAEKLRLPAFYGSFTTDKDRPTR